jgi:hypothetical protein
MANATLAPEDDDSQFPRGQINPPPRVKPADVRSRTEVQSFHFGFKSQTAGFEILPWPGIDPSAKPKDTVAIAMKYLIDAKDQRNRGGRK